jgi:twinkle protein
MKKEETKLLLETVDDSFIRIEDIKDSMLRQFREGKTPGSKTYVSDIDNIVTKSGFKTKAWSWRQGEFNIWTGYNNEGKTKKLVYLALLKAVNEDKKFAIFSPENFPPDDFFDDMIHTLLGKTTDKKSKDFNMTEKEYLNGLDRIKRNFFFVYPKKNGNIDFTIETIESVFEYLIWEHNVFGVIADPYLKIKHEMMPGEPEHLYASRFMMDRINFTRKNNVSYHMVMHQTTPRKLPDGNYPKPNLYAIKGGGTWADSVDNVISVWRPNRGIDPLDTRVTIISEKIKNQKLVGVPFEVEMDFDRKKNRYVSLDGRDYFDGSLIEKTEQPIYNPDRFISDGRNDFDPAPF